MNAEQTIQACYVSETTIKLPGVQLERSVYEDVRKRLEGIGGKWKGGKVSGFVFKYDPSGLLRQLQSGETINLKQAFQFFATPDALADRLVELAEINHGHTILEPSAGQGAIVNAVRRHDETALVDCYELMESNCYVLSKVAGAELIGEDFYATTPAAKYDRIVANPPFTKNQDIDHIQRMHEWLTPEGRLVSLASTSWQIGNQSKQIAFRQWLNEVGGKQINVPAGAFKESGTNVATCIIYIDKGGILPENEVFECISPEKYKKPLYIPEPLEKPEVILARIQQNFEEMNAILEKMKSEFNPSLVQANQQGQLSLF